MNWLWDTSSSQAKQKPGTRMGDRIMKQLLKAINT
jgi:hypothetical protein